MAGMAKTRKLVDALTVDVAALQDQVAVDVAALQDQVDGLLAEVAQLRDMLAATKQPAAPRPAPPAKATGAKKD